MSARIPQEVVDEAILVLDVYASQPTLPSGNPTMTRRQVVQLLGMRDDAPADALASLAWNSASNIEPDFVLSAAEGAQMLREGWRP